MFLLSSILFTYFFTLKQWHTEGVQTVRRPQASSLGDIQRNSFRKENVGKMLKK